MVEQHMERITPGRRLLQELCHHNMCNFCVWLNQLPTGPRIELVHLVHGGRLVLDARYPPSAAKASHQHGPFAHTLHVAKVNIAHSSAAKFYFSDLRCKLMVVRQGGTGSR